MNTLTIFVIKLFLLISLFHDQHFLSVFFFIKVYHVHYHNHTLWPPSSVFNNFPVVINTTQTTTSIITEANVIFNFPTIILVTHLHLEENYHLNHCYTIPTTMNNPATIFLKSLSEILHCHFDQSLTFFFRLYSL